MMAEFRDPNLESLFAEAKRDYEGEAITAQVMAQTRNRLVSKAVGGALLGLIALLIAWYVFAVPLLDFAILLSQFITNPLIDLGEGWLALVFMPINNIASISVALGKLSLMAWKRLTGTSLLR
jgi:hypothetical protein